MCAKRLLLSLISIMIILTCYKFDFTVQLQIPKVQTVFVPVPVNQLEDIQWSSSNVDYMESTCGTFKAYNKRTVENINNRWYVVYMSNIPSKTDYCSQFTNIKEPCGCLGIDFTTSLNHGTVQFVMFSTNAQEKSVTYEIATASMIGKNQLNLNEIILRSFLLQSNARMVGKGGYIIPTGVVVDSDNFSSYMTLLICVEEATQPIVMILSDALPMSDQTKYKAFKYLQENGFDANLFKVDHSNCKHAQNIFGF